MDAVDDPVTINFVKNTFNDQLLNKWFDKIWDC